MIEMQPLIFGIIFGLLLLLAGLSAWRMDRCDNRFQLVDYFLGPNGKASRTALGHLTALVVSTWGFVYLTLAYKLTEWYFGLYMATWAAAHLASKYLDRKGDKHD